MTTTGVSCVGGALSSSELEPGVVMKEAVEGVLAGDGVSDGGMEEGSGLEVEVESGSTGVSQCVMSLPNAEEML